MPRKPEALPFQCEIRKRIEPVYKEIDNEKHSAGYEDENEGMSKNIAQPEIGKPYRSNKGKARSEIAEGYHKKSHKGDQEIVVRKDPDRVPDRKYKRFGKPGLFFLLGSVKDENDSAYLYHCKDSHTKQEDARKYKKQGIFDYHGKALPCKIGYAAEPYDAKKSQPKQREHYHYGKKPVEKLKYKQRFQIEEKIVAKML